MADPHPPGGLPAEGEVAKAINDCLRASGIDGELNEADARVVISALTAPPSLPAEPSEAVWWRLRRAFVTTNGNPFKGPQLDLLAVGLDAVNTGKGLGTDSPSNLNGESVADQSEALSLSREEAEALLHRCEKAPGVDTNEVSGRAKLRAFLSQVDEEEGG